METRLVAEAKGYAATAIYFSIDNSIDYFNSGKRRSKSANNIGIVETVS